MFINYCKLAWRNLFRNKLHTSINIGGLIIGFTIGLSILLVVYGQYSFDGFHANGKRIYQAYQDFSKTDGGIMNAFGLATATTYKAEAPAIEKATRFMDGGNHITYNGKDLMIPVTLVDADFFSMFSFPLVKGDKVNPLKNLTDVVITEDAAKRIFGAEDPVGKTITTSVRENMALVVSAVVKNVQNSSIKFDMLARIENQYGYTRNKNNWDNRSNRVYIQLKEGATPRQAEMQLRQIDKKYVPDWYTGVAKKETKTEQDDMFITCLLPLRDVHHSTRVNRNKAVSTVQVATLLTVGLLIIFIACFNFVNINLANAFTRSREIGVRKCLGAVKWRLFTQLWSESFLVCFIAFIFSLFLVNVFLHSVDGVNQNMSLSSLVWQPGFMILALCLLLLVSLIAGGYPSWLMMRFKAVETLKGKISLKRKSVLRSSLIVMQFVIACIMISCTYIIYQQYQYLQNADLGISTDYIISVPLHDPGKGKETIEKLRSRLASNPQMISVSGSNINLGRGADRRTVKATTGFTYKEKTVTTNVASVDYDYLKTLGLKLVEGRDFDKSFGADTTTNNVVISESVARQLKENDVVGKTIGADSTSRGWHIIGVFPDFHLYTMTEQLAPLTLTMNKNDAINYCFIKTSSRDLIANMETIKKEMALLEPGQEFNGSFVNENVNNWYQEQKTMAILFSIAATVAILLSCSGLLAMVLLIIRQRVKEIGVRKILGASVQNISLLISKEFLFLVFIAVLIASPIAWLVMNAWLEAFPYRIQIQWWMFALVALMAFIISLLTISINTVRAAMQNPVESLRTE